MRMNTQRILAVLLSLILLLALAPAGWAVNFEQACSIKVLPAAADAKHEDGTVFIDDIDASSTPFVYDLYRVAYAKEVPGYDTYDYALVGPFTGLDIKADAPTERNADFWADLAQKAAKIALGLDEGASQTTPIGYAADSYSGNKMEEVVPIPGVTVTTGEGADAASKTVSAGLYLVIARSSDYAWNETSSYVVIGKDQSISTSAHSDTWDYHYAPQLISIPTKSPITEGEVDIIKTSNPGEWIYDPTAVLKPTASPRNGSLKITKTLTDYADLSKDDTYFEPMTFSFSVVGKDENGKTVYQREVALSVTSPENEKEVITLDDIPIGTSVTVTESYSGAHASGAPASQTVVIQRPTGTSGATVTPSVSFTNTNTNTHRGGHGVENTFEFNKSTGGWTWIANGTPQSDTSWNEGEEQ